MTTERDYIEGDPVKHWWKLYDVNVTLEEGRLFQREYLNVPQQEDPLRKFAEEYHSRCDAFDNAVCTGRNKHGEKSAATNDELRASNRNATSVRNEIAHRERIPMRDLQTAIHNHRPKR